ACSCANTEEGLTRVAQKYFEKHSGCRERYGNDLERMRLHLRWSPADWEYFEEGGSFFSDYWALEQSLGDPYRDESLGPAFISIYLQVLRQLDKSGLLGRGQQREQITINLLRGDQSDRERLEWAMQLNPRPVCVRLKADFLAVEADLEAETGCKYEAALSARDIRM